MLLVGIGLFMPVVIWGITGLPITATALLLFTVLAFKIENKKNRIDDRIDELDYRRRVRNWHTSNEIRRLAPTIKKLATEALFRANCRAVDSFLNPRTER